MAIVDLFAMLRSHRGDEMARTSNRRWKGCQFCKPHKHAACGQAHRKAWPDLRRIGKKRRVSRHDLGDAAE